MILKSCNWRSVNWGWKLFSVTPDILAELGNLYLDLGYLTQSLRALLILDAITNNSYSSQSEVCIIVLFDSIRRNNSLVKINFTITLYKKQFWTFVSSLVFEKCTYFKLIGL